MKVTDTLFTSNVQWRSNSGTGYNNLIISITLHCIFGTVTQIFKVCSGYYLPAIAVLKQYFFLQPQGHFKTRAQALLERSEYIPLFRLLMKKSSVAKKAFSAVAAEAVAKDINRYEKLRNIAHFRIYKHLLQLFGIISCTPWEMNYCVLETMWFW